MIILVMNETARSGAATRAAGTLPSQGRALAGLTRESRAMEPSHSLTIKVGHVLTVLGWNPVGLGACDMPRSAAGSRRDDIATRES